MKQIALLLITLIVLSPLLADSHFGTELDAFPYLTGGYYFSFWGGNDTYHLRGVVAHSNLPDFVVPNGFEDEKTDVCAVIVDRFLDPAKSGHGWWIGTGFEYWKVNLTNSGNHIDKSFGEGVYTLGAGYVIKLYKNVSLNPWVAGHVILNPQAPKIGGERPSIAPVLGEGSLKIGIQW